ncbi:MAG: flagellar hook-length control protein FliK [Rubrivivax sp.]|nr:MAG: flagellar hook-length control protein FliK [Rubrivivax sp.]
MTRPLNATTPGAANVNATDWAAKLASNQVGADASALQSDFSRWMERHATAAPQASATGAQASANPAMASSGQGAGGSLEARNAMARAQANAVQAKRQVPVARAETAHAPKVDKPKTASSEAPKSPAGNAHGPTKTEATAKAKSKDAVGKAERTDATAQADAADEAATPDAALLTAPVDALAMTQAQVADPSPSADPSSMMAWLASLTQGEAPGQAVAPDTAKPGAEGQGAGAVTMSALLGGTAGGRPDGASAAKGADKGPAAGIDVSALQATEGRLAVLPEGADPAAKGLDFASTLSTEMMRGLAGKPGEVQAAAPRASDTLATPMGSPEFPQALAERVGMWVKATGEDGTLSAELHLNPAEMGPISVKISLDGQTAQVDFAAATLETRRAIEETLPMLSAALDDAGFSLGGSGVSDQTAQQQFGQAPGQAGTAPWNGRLASDGDQNDQLDGRPAPAPQAGRRGGLDLYA